MPSDRERWNDRHRATLADGDAAQSPTALLLEHGDLLDGQPRGGALALDVACGLGRNTFHLAERGFAVEAVDVSDVAIEHVGRLAGERGLDVRTLRADLSEGRLPGGPYAVVVNVNYLERHLFGALAAALAPGGLLLFETRLAESEPTGVDPAYLLGFGELGAAFGHLDVLLDREEDGRAALVARRPHTQGALEA